MSNRPHSVFEGQSFALLTDLYQLTMACAYWKGGLASKEALFHMSFRKRPFKSGFTIAAGLESLIDYLQHFRFDVDDLAYLATLTGYDGTPLFPAEFLDYLKNLRFSCDIDAVPEGTAVFPQEPLVRVKGPLIQCQILESPLLNLINFPTLIATKAARLRIAAQKDSLLEFGLRRAQGINGALTASRAAYIGGCDATSNVMAGKLYQIPVKGTHSHSWIMAFDDELEAFKVYARNQTNNCVFLVDTYDTLLGVKKAIEVGQWLKSQGKRFLGIRLDSGDLAYLSIESRKLLDAAGFEDTVIIASNELDEGLINDLKRQGAQITVWGVGTNLVTARDQPALDGVYKLSAIRDEGDDWKYKLKLSEQLIKVSNPGFLQVRRFSESQDYVADVIFDENLGFSNDRTIVDPLDPTRQKKLNDQLTYKDLLIPIFRQGELVYPLPALKDIRAYAQEEIGHLQTGIKRFINPHEYVVGMDQKLYDLKVSLIRKIRSGSSEAYIKPQDQATW